MRKGGCTGSSKSIHVKTAHFWQSHVAAHYYYADKTSDAHACLFQLFASTQTSFLVTKPRGYKTIFILNSAEHETYPTHKCLNTNNCWHFNIYKQDKYNIRET